MGRIRFFASIFITVLWLGLMVWVAISFKVWELKPNELGDFLSGFLAPLAFFWLILGYLQQGDELRLSTEALRLQAEELNNSVAQQRELVAVTR